MEPPPPALLSTTMVCLTWVLKALLKSLAVASVPAPGGKGTINLMGRSGNSAIECKDSTIKDANKTKRGVQRERLLGVFMGLIRFKV